MTGKRVKWLLTALVATLVFMGFGGQATAATELVVGPGEAYATLQDAADAANDGDRIVLRDDDTAGAQFSGSYATEGLTIVSDGGPYTIGDGVVFTGSVDLTLEDVAIENQSGHALELSGPANSLTVLGDVAIEAGGPGMVYGIRATDDLSVLTADSTLEIQANAGGINAGGELVYTQTGDGAVTTIQGGTTGPMGAALYGADLTLDVSGGSFDAKAQYGVLGTQIAVDVSGADTRVSLTGEGSSTSIGLGAENGGADLQVKVTGGILNIWGDSSGTYGKTLDLTITGDYSRVDIEGGQDGIRMLDDSYDIDITMHSGSLVVMGRDGYGINGTANVGGTGLLSGSPAFFYLEGGREPYILPNVDIDMVGTEQQTPYSIYAVVGIPDLAPSGDNPTYIFVNDTDIKLDVSRLAMPMDLTTDWDYYVGSSMSNGFSDPNLVRSGGSSTLDISDLLLTPGTYNFQVRQTVTMVNLQGDETSYTSEISRIAQIVVYDENAEVYTVSYDTDGGTPVPPDEKVPGGQQATKPQDPEKKGYIFLGWYDVETTSTYSFQEEVWEDITLRAEWARDDHYHCVHYEPDGGTPEPDDEYVFSGETATEPEEPTKDGYIFDGWYTDDSRTDLYNFDTLVEDNITLYAKWTKLHTVDFESNGGSSVDSQEVRDGDTAVEPDDPTRDDGYVFDGWYRDEELTEPYDFDDPVEDNITLYAKWTELHTVSYESNGGSYVPSEKVKHGDTATRPASPVRNGYYFLAWYEDEALTIPYDFTKPVTEDITLYAQWEDDGEYCTVYYESNGGSYVPPDQYKLNDMTVRPADPTKPGCIFDGWYTDKDLTIPYYFEEEICGDITLYAKWIEEDIYYTVYFESNGGSTVPNQQVQPGGTATRPTDPTRPGYIFDGWYTDEELTQLYNFDEEICGDITLYAKWIEEEIYHTVHFESNGGSAVPNQQVQPGGTATRPTDPTRPGYIFDGWYIDDSLTQLYNFDEEIYEDIYLYAKWIEIDDEGEYVMVYYESNGGSAVPDEQVPIGNQATEPEDPTRDGYDFDGWYIDEELTIPYDFDEEVWTDITLYAKWVPHETPPYDPEYTVIYDPNGGYGSPLSITEMVGDDHEVMSNLDDSLSFYRINHVFMGWSLDPEATPDDVLILPGELVTGEGGEEIILYAVWNEMPFRLEPHYSYIVGFEDGEIKPMGNLTRAQAATILFRLLDDDVRDAYYTADNNFSDVNKSDWHNKAVSTIAAMDAIEGYEDGTFRPNDYIKRSELAAIIARLSGAAPYTGDDYFKDIAGEWYQDYVNLAASLGWVSGYGDGTFLPENHINRAETMVMINNVLDRNPQSDADMLPDMITWPDNQDTSEWYYLDVQEATNSHTFARNEKGEEVWLQLVDNPDWLAMENPD